MDSCIKITTLQTERLTLEPLEMKHTEELFHLFSDKSLYTYVDQSVPESLNWLRNTFRRLVRRKSEDGKQIWLNWISKAKGSNKLVGYLEATVESDHISLAYYTFPPHTQRGFAKEGVAGIMSYLKKEYSPEKFILEMDTRNRPSIKIAESLGFQWVSTINNARYFKNSQSHEFRFEYLVEK